MQTATIRRLLVAGALHAAFALTIPPTTAEASYVASAGTFTTPSIVQARARNGLTGFEGVLFTPAAPLSGPGLQMNPVGAPAWSYGQLTGFEFRYDSINGSSTWSIDFHRDGDYLDSEESVTSVSSSLEWVGFNQVNIRLEGNGTHGVQVLDFTPNGTNFGDYQALGVENQLFTHTGGSSDILATGRLMFTGSGGSQEIPRFWIQTGSSFVVPAPGAFALLGLAGLARARRRR